MTASFLRKLGLAATAASAVGFAGAAQAAEQIRIVGSSTVFPFTAYVAEEFGVTTDYPTPVVESTGTGGGMKLFCQGVGADTPDITNASRRMKPSELKLCQSNGVASVVEVKIGYDGIVFAQNKGNPALNLTREQITLAVAAEVPVDGGLVPNPYEKWSDIDPSLPDREILIYGPPTSSGTRDAFEELVMAYGSEHIKGYPGEYTKIRQDGHYVPAGENDNLIVQRLADNPVAFGIFGYSFLEENRSILQAASIDGVEPKRELISSGEYPVARSLFFYVKKAHLDKVPGMQEFVSLYLSPQMIGDRGYLKSLGLIPLPPAMLQAQREQWQDRTEVKLAQLEG